MADLQLNFFGKTPFKGAMNGSIEQVLVHVFPKPEINESANEVYQKSGVYLLLKPLPGGLRYKVYVGQSEQLGKRLKQHVKDKDKDFKKAVVAYSVASGLDGRLLNHMEKTLIKFCEYHPLLESTNKTVGNFASLERTKQRECDTFLDDMATLITAMGFAFMKDYLTLPWNDDTDALRNHYTLPEPRPSHIPETNAAPPPALSLAETVPVAPAVENTPSAPPASEHLSIDQWPVFEFERKKNGHKGFLAVRAPGNFELLEHSKTAKPNKKFYTSPSAPAQTVTGCAQAGWFDWKTPDGETLDEFNARHGNPLGRMFKPRTPKTSG
jgi:hypothetical protein